MSDLHEYDAASGVWTELTFQATSPGTQPSGRIDMGFVATHGKLYVFGGQAGIVSSPPTFQTCWIV